MALPALKWSDLHGLGMTECEASTRAGMRMDVPGGVMLQVWAMGQTFHSHIRKWAPSRTPHRAVLNNPSFFFFTDNLQVQPPGTVFARFLVFSQRAGDPRQ